MNVSQLCNRVHEILEVLPSWKFPSNHLPKQGLYFFYEDGEITSHTGKPRIVRVGTHGPNRTLKRRLRDHYNGNREGSIFRKELGSALLKRSGASEDQIREWRKKRKLSRSWHTFEKIERQVSEILRLKFTFKALSVDTEEERSHLEETIIPTLAACSKCQPSNDWLGKFAWKETIISSGLWNDRFAHSPARLTRQQLIRLEELVQKTKAGKCRKEA